MTHVLCRSLRWPRCPEVLDEVLERFGDTHIILLGELMHDAAPCHLLSLREKLQGFQFSVLPRDDADRTHAALVGCKVVEDCAVDDAWCSTDGSAPSDAARIYSCRRLFLEDRFVLTRDQLGVLVPASANEYCASRHVVRTTPNSVERVDLRVGPRCWDYREGDVEILPQRDDFVTVYYPAPMTMSLVRMWKRAGARVRIVHRRVKAALDFKEYFRSYLSNDIGQRVWSLLKRDVVIPKQVRFLRLRAENVASVRARTWDMTKTGLQHVNGPNDSGKTTFHMHALLWVMTGVWPRISSFEQILRVGATSGFVELTGTTASVRWTLHRSLTRHDHCLRFHYGDMDCTEDTPLQTTATFHRLCVGSQEEMSHRLFRWWQNRVLMTRDARAPSCPWSRALVSVYARIMNRHDELKTTRNAVRRLLRRSEKQLTVLRKMANDAQASDARWQSYQHLIDDALNEEAPPDPPPEPEDTRETLADALAERMAALDVLRQDYFQLVRTRREMRVRTAGYVARDLTELRRRVQHAQQERDARRQQTCALGTRVQTFITLQRAERTLQDREAQVEMAERQQAVIRSINGLQQVTERMREEMARVDTLKTRLRDWDAAATRRRDMEAAKRRYEQRRDYALRAAAQVSIMGRYGPRLRQSIADQERCHELLHMRMNDVEGELMRHRDLFIVRDLNDAWSRRVMQYVDDRMTQLWHDAGWCPGATFHHELLYIDGTLAHMTDSMKDRCACVSFMTYRDLIPEVPLIILKDVATRFDTNTRQGLERLMRNWCEEHPRRSCWWLGRCVL